MDFICKNFLNNDDVAAIEQLEKKSNYCILEENMEYSVPLYYLAYSGSSLTGVLTLLPVREGFEVNALVDESFRRQGVFTGLLSLARKECHDCLLQIPYHKDNSPFDITKTSMCRKLLYQDLFMTLCKSDATACVSLSEPLYVDFKNNCYTLKLRSTRGRHAIIGKVNLEPTINFTNVWGVEIKKPYRGKGYGLMLMSYAINDYFAGNSKQLFLHVESTNTAAVALYSKLNFKKYVTIDNYEL